MKSDGSADTIKNTKFDRNVFQVPLQTLVHKYNNTNTFNSSKKVLRLHENA